MKKGKTGGGGGEWVEFDSPKPPAVEDHYEFWGDQPPELSERCQWWLRQIQRGWRPNRRIASECYDCSAEWYGIWIWEFNEVICVALQNGRMGDYKERIMPTLRERAALIYPKGSAEYELYVKLSEDLDKLLFEELNNVIFLGDGSVGELKGILND